MAEQKHLSLLLAGAITWHEWRTKNPEMEIDISSVNLQ